MSIAYYDKHAAQFCRETKEADMGACRKRFTDLLEQRFSLADGAGFGRDSLHILDAGCGSGRDVKAFLDAGYRVTALDASKEMCREAGQFLKQDVICARFEELEWEQEFDGIWACASLLHVPYAQIPDVLKRLWNALKQNGVFYASFKYGTGRRREHGRVFYDYTETALEGLMAAQFSIEQMFVTRDVRKGREDERWINVLAEKKEQLEGCRLF